MNRFIVSLKRILNKKMYLVMILLLIAMTITYKCLPSSKKTTDIKVALCFNDQDIHVPALKSELDNATTLYTFYYVDSKEKLIKDVQSGYAECGLYFPDGFFVGYMSGSAEPKAELYEVPATTLSATISESVFHYVFKVASPDMLLEIVHEQSLNKELKERMLEYMSGDEVFQMSSATEGEFEFKDMDFHIELPVKEFACLFTIFAALFGLLLHMQDKEKNIYLVLSKGEVFGIQTTLIIASMLPIVITGFITNLIAYGTSTLLYLCVITIGSFIVTTLLSFIIKKSTILTKVLPIILLIAIAYFFVTSLI